MITAEAVMMKQSHFRLKVDLSKFFHDVRRICWIFIDRTEIQQIIHVKQHISKLFNIAEPFHLLLNDIEYLPPIEDVRILKENEVILVVPGSGINDKVNLIKTCNSMHNAETQQINTLMAVQDISDNNLLNDKRPISIGNATKDMTFYSINDDTMIDDTEEESGSKITDNNVTKDSNEVDSIVPKRKRIRTRKSKKRSSLLSPPSTNEKDISKKPRIIDSLVLHPETKHIKFDDTGNDKNTWYDNFIEEEEPTIIKTSSCRELNTLLALGQTSTPLTFMSKKKNGNEASKVSIDKIKSNILSSNNNLIQLEVEPINGEKDVNIFTFQKISQLQTFLEKFALMTRRPEIKDIIAFKTLKIGADYSPQQSNFIITEVVDLCAQNENYTLKILAGKEEVQVPIGKLYVSSDDENANQNETNTFILNYSQMQEPRLISQILIP